MRVTLLNGPPRSGKDYAGELIATAPAALGLAAGPKVHVDKFARRLKESAHALYGIFVGLRPAPHDHFENRKDAALPHFFGRSPREVYIALSERHMKAMHGRGIFGRLLAEDLEAEFPSRGSGLELDELIVTDSGFREEAEALLEHLRPSSCRLVRLRREGCTFDGDSRSYLDLSDLGVPCLDVENPGDRAGLLSNLVEALGARP